MTIYIIRAILHVGRDERHFFNDGLKLEMCSDVQLQPNQYHEIRIRNTFDASREIMDKM